MPDVRAYRYVIALEFAGTVEVEVEDDDDDESLRAVAFDFALEDAFASRRYDVIDHELEDVTPRD